MRNVESSSEYNPHGCEGLEVSDHGDWDTNDWLSHVAARIRPGTTEVWRSKPPERRGAAFWLQDPFPRHIGGMSRLKGSTTV